MDNRKRKINSKKSSRKKIEGKKIEEIILKFDEVHDDYQNFDEDEDGYDKNIAAKESIEIVKDSLGDYIEKDYLYGIETIKEFLEKKLFFI